MTVTTIAPAVAISSTPGSAAPAEAAAPELFAGLLSACTSAPVPASAYQDTSDTSDPLVPVEVAATNLMPPPVPMPLVEAPEPESASAGVHGAHALARGQASAPGQLKEPGTSAKAFAPGQIKKLAAETPPPVAATPPPTPAPELGATPTAPEIGATPTAPELVTTPPAPAPPVDAVPLPDVVAATPAALATADVTSIVVPAPVAPAHSPVPMPKTEPTHTVRPALAAAAKRLTHEGGRTSLVVRLDPPELGAVLVRMTVRDGQVEVTLRAPDLAAQGGLLAQAPEIQQVLKEAGLDLASFDVTYGALAKGQSEDQRQTPDRGTPQQRGGADGTVHVTDDVIDPQPAGTWL